MKLEVSGQIFEKIFKYQISRQSNQWELSCSMRTDGRTDMTKVIVALRNFTLSGIRTQSGQTKINDELTA
jgi:hypothetical protein